MNYNPGIANYYKKSFRLINSSKNWFEISQPGAAKQYIIIKTILSMDNS